MNKMFLVCKEVCYDNGIVYWAIFNNFNDANNYVNQHQNFDLFIKEVQNGEEL